MFYGVKTGKKAKEIVEIICRGLSVYLKKAVPLRAAFPAFFNFFRETNSMIGENTMNPTKQNNDLWKNLEPLLATIDQVSQKIPGCESLCSDYEDYWTPGVAKDVREQELEDIRRDVKLKVHLWLKRTPAEQIILVVKSLHPAARIYLCQLVRAAFKGFFEFDYKGLPNAVVVPSTFPVMKRTKKTAELIPLERPLIRKYGETTVTISGHTTKSEDGQLAFALLLLMRQKKPIFTEKNITFQTSLTELANTMLKSNPYHEPTRKVIWNGLRRLRSVVLDIAKFRKINRYIGGILDGARKLEEDKNGEITVYLDRVFVELIDEGFVKLVPRILFNLNPTETNLYEFLMHQKTFNQFGYLNKISMMKVWDYAGLAGIDDKPQAKSYIRSRLKKGLDGLKAKSVIQSYSLKGDQLEVFSTDKIGVEKWTEKEAPQRKSLTELEKEDLKRQQDRCGGFGIKCEQLDECDECSVWHLCVDEYDKWKKPDQGNPGNII